MGVGQRKVEEHVDGLHCLDEEVHHEAPRPSQVPSYPQSVHIHAANRRTQMLIQIRIEFAEKSLKELESGKKQDKQDKQDETAT